MAEVRLRDRIWWQPAGHGYPAELRYRRKGITYGLRFGKPERPSFIERMQGHHDVPTQYYYGPFGLALIIPRSADA